MTKRINQQEEKLKQLVGTYELRKLYRLRSACWDVFYTFNFFTFYLEDNHKAEVTDAYLKIFDRIKVEFPETCAFIDFDNIVYEAVDSYLLQLQKEKDISVKSASRKTAKKKVAKKKVAKKKPETIGASKWQKALEPIKKLQALSESRISEEDWGAREKAELFLAENTVPDKEYGDLEALVYLRSRGIECGENIAKVIQSWKADADRATRRFAQGNTTINFGDDEEPPKTFGKKSLSEASQIEKWHSSGLENFWDQNYDGTDATARMLRAVEWCDIVGFDVWWKRWAKEWRQELVNLTEDKFTAAIYLLNICRSDLAVSLIGDTLDKYLFLLQTPEGFRAEHPWETFDGLECADIPSVAAAILFATYKTKCKSTDKELLAKAGDLIFKTQDSSGGWRFQANDSKLSIETTAMVIHAMALAKPQGWERAVRAGVKWLWSKQGKMGCWPERGFPDPAYLTVLVLDAIDLAEGKTNLTFKLPETFAQSTPEEPFDKPVKLDQFCRWVTIGNDRHEIANNKAQDVLEELVKCRDNWFTRWDGSRDRKQGIDKLRLCLGPKNIHNQNLRSIVLSVRKDGYKLNPSVKIINRPRK